ncbi:hypothetical protein GCM10027068_33090 [Prescottella soli]
MTTGIPGSATPITVHSAHETPRRVDTSSAALRNRSVSDAAAPANWGTSSGGEGTKAATVNTLRNGSRRGDAFPGSDLFQ